MARRLKILFDRDRELVPEHARRVVRALDRMECDPRAMRHEPRPRGVPWVSAVAPIVCDSCGLTFWARDPYAQHLGCQGYRPHSLGF